MNIIGQYGLTMSCYPLDISKYNISARVNGGYAQQRSHILISSYS